MWLLRLTSTASVRQENNRWLCNGCAFLYTRPLKVSLLEPNDCQGFGGRYEVEVVLVDAGEVKHREI